MRIHEANLMLIQTEKRLDTQEEYLALEKTADYKNEYHDGEIVSLRDCW